MNVSRILPRKILVPFQWQLIFQLTGRCSHWRYLMLGICFQDKPVNGWETAYKSLSKCVHAVSQVFICGGLDKPVSCLCSDYPDTAPGIPSPISTSGHTGMKVTYGFIAATSVLEIISPLYLTGSCSIHRLITITGFERSFSAYRKDTYPLHRYIGYGYKMIINRVR